MKYRFYLFLLSLCACASVLHAQNPYMPMWEYIPDGEPYVFEDPDQPGHYRVYVYGSHDQLVNAYCGLDQVVWSAPVTDLSAWRCDGVIFRSERDGYGRLLNPKGEGDLLYAPDVALRIDSTGRKRYYLYPNNMADGRRNMVAASDRPDGPFEVINWSATNPSITSGSLDFDPAVFVDDDGRAYAYWGFEESWAGELLPDMATVRQETLIHNMIPGHKQDSLFRFFEASSMRKIEDKYVFVYSRVTAPGEFGLPSSNYTLAYAYGDSPLGPFTYGGTLIDGRARGKDANGKIIPTAYPYGNTHGSLCLIGDQWWLFYHRQTGTDEFSRQAMVAPVSVAIKDGKVLISEAEYTSEGFRTEGLDPQTLTPAGWACYLTHPQSARQEYPHIYFSGSYVRPVRAENPTNASLDPRAHICPVVNNTAGSVVGYKYFCWDAFYKHKTANMIVRLIPHGMAGRIRIMIGSEPYRAKEIGQIVLTAEMPEESTEMVVECNLPRKLRGKHALFFVFSAEEQDRSLCDMEWFRFSRVTTQ